MLNFFNLLINSEHLHVAAPLTGGMNMPLVDHVWGFILSSKISVF